MNIFLLSSKFLLNGDFFKILHICFLMTLVTKKFSLSSRKDLREQLMRQIEEKCVALKMQLSSKLKEAEYVCEVDRLALSSEREQRIQHSRAMTAYRDENKRVQSHTCNVHC